MSDGLPVRVLQFGTSRFLQAHADLFFSEAEPALGVAVVQTTDDPTRARRLQALAAPEGYPVHIRGLVDGQPVDEERRIRSVRRCLQTAQDWAAIERLATDPDVSVFLSNTGDAGYAPRPADPRSVPCQEMSFPAKLCHLLAARHRAGGPPLTLFPMELVPRNGAVLKACVLEAAEKQGHSTDFRDWLERQTWANSLVDRIVSEPIEPAGAVAEPYALWAIEAAPGMAAPCDHPAIRVVPDLAPLERLKLHILNLGHSVLADFWLHSDASPSAIVRGMMKAEPGETVRAIWRDEVLPAFAATGMGDEAAAYCATTEERFLNPFLDHRIADIAQNHGEKVSRRVGGLFDWADPTIPMPRLRAIAGRTTA
ncbi:MAG: mannitol dehydrogenase family protein [Mesorhizobium sp.]